MLVEETKTQKNLLLILEQVNALLKSDKDESEIKADLMKLGFSNEEINQALAANRFQFRISSGLKSIIGKDLITDQYIAVFELVKNSFDAHANNVKLIFEHIRNEKNNLFSDLSHPPKLLIIDNGKGMTKKEIKDKWLFVAYSAKKEGEEDKDYRAQIASNRKFAGAFGIGRFSCDRLGSHLNLLSISKNNLNKVENLQINWADFEKNAKTEFMEVDVFHQELKPNEIDEKLYKEIKDGGTILEITNLRDKWERTDLQKLKRSLQKLVNPDNNVDRVSNFSITMEAKEEIIADNKSKHDREIINGEIRNTIFETLGIKTTQIETELINEGELIVTTIKDKGQLIYKLTEKNTFEELKLKEIDKISINLFFLNRSAKATFKRRMGVDNVNYGSVFMYKNGFRIYPLGEKKDDSLGLDLRKTQGYARYLGNRDIIGRISISGENEELKEKSSRDGGLIRTPAYEELVDFFYSKCLRRLEKYVVDLIKWGEPFEGQKTALSTKDVKDDIFKLIQRLTRAENVIDIEYPKDFFQIIEASQEKSATSVLKNLGRMAKNTDNPELIKEVKRLNKQLNQLKKAKEEAETGELLQEKKRKIVEKDIEIVAEQKKVKEKQVEYFKSLTSLDFDTIVSLMHQIGVNANTIKNKIDFLTRKYHKSTTKESKEFTKNLEIIRFETQKILNVSKFGTKAGFNLTSEEATIDIVSFVKQYIENVSRIYIASGFTINLFNFDLYDFILKVKPIELTIIIDNIISNSRKANARELNITVNKISNDKVEFFFKDNGKGITKNLDVKSIFEQGISTTRGAGLGLFHIKQIVTNFGGTVSAESKPKKGFNLIITLDK